jgi:hypothetical protein
MTTAGARGRSKTRSKRWSAQITTTTLRLPEGLFTRPAAEIARGLRRAALTAKGRSTAASPYQAAMGMLNLYINRAGKNLRVADRRRVEAAKGQLRKLFGRAAPVRRAGTAGGKRPQRTRVVLAKVTRNRSGPKKFTAHFKVDGRPRRTQFGARGYEDYTTHHDKERRARYRARHRKDLRTRDLTRAGYLSYYLLWGENTSLSKNIAAYRCLLAGRV